jgi:hypothetical protein
MKIKQVQRVITNIDNEIKFYADKLNERSTAYPSSKAASTATEQQVTAAISVLEELITTKYLLRRKVKEFNTDKIDFLTAKIAELEDLKNYYAVASQKGVPIEQYNRATFGSGITPEYEQAMRTKTKVIDRCIQSTKDSCNGINAQGDIELNAPVINTLQKYGLID